MEENIERDTSPETEGDYNKKKSNTNPVKINQSYLLPGVNKYNNKKFSRQSTDQDQSQVNNDDKYNKIFSRQSTVQSQVDSDDVKISHVSVSTAGHTNFLSTPRIDEVFKEKFETMNGDMNHLKCSVNKILGLLEKLDKNVENKMKAQESIGGNEAIQKN